MTPEQIAIFKADLALDQELNNKPMTGDGAWDIALAYNLVASPAYYVWRTDVPVVEIMKNGMDWTQVDNLSVGKARIWEWMTDLGTFNAAKTNIRAGIDACWTGTAQMLAVRAAVYTHCYRPATRFEKLFATGAGTTVAPATMSFEGTVQYQTIEEARRS